MPAAIEADLQAIEGADLLVVASPVYRGAHTGLFKHLFAFFQADALPIGVYATEKDFDGYTVNDPALQERIALAIARALPHVAPVHARRLGVAA